MDLWPNSNRLPWKRALGLAVSLLTLYLVFRRIDVAALLPVFRQMRPGWFFAAVALFGFACLCAGWRWHLMLRLTGVPVHLGATLRVYFIGHAFSFILFGPALGDVAKSALYARWYALPLPPVIAAAPLDRLLGLGGLMGFCALAFGLAAASGLASTGSPAGVNLSPALIIAVLAAGALALLVIVRWRPASESPLARTFKAFAEGMTRLLASPRLALPGLVLGFVVQAASCGLLALCLKAVVTVPCPWTKMLWTFPVLAAMNAIPSVSGLGVRESAALALLTLYGVPPADAVVASLLVLPVNLLPVAFGGWFLWQGEKTFTIQSATAPTRVVLETISIVIPTLNEAGELAETIRRARLVPEVCEIIVADGGSQDATREIAAQAGGRVIDAGRGRGRQLRAGAATAVGDVVLLLHADTWLPPETGRAIQNCLRDQTVVGGGCWKTFRDGSPMLRGSLFKCAFRLFLARRVMADQAIFVRREILEAVGGVPDLPLMEEFELCRRLRGVGRLALADATVITSARRFARLGVVRTYARMWRVTLQYYLGTPPAKLRQIYEKE